LVYHRGNPSIEKQHPSVRFLPTQDYEVLTMTSTFFIPA
jgi:hypothetical protein